MKQENFRLLLPDAFEHELKKGFSHLNLNLILFEKVLEKTPVNNNLLPTFGMIKDSIAIIEREFTADVLHHLITASRFLHDIRQALSHVSVIIYHIEKNIEEKMDAPELKRTYEHLTISIQSFFDLLHRLGEHYRANKETT